MQTHSRPMRRRLLIALLAAASPLLMGASMLGSFRPATPEEFSALRHELVASYPSDKMGFAQWDVVRVSSGRIKDGSFGFCAKIRLFKDGSMTEPRVAYGFIKEFDKATGVGPVVMDFIFDRRGAHETHDAMCEEWGAWSTGT